MLGAGRVAVDQVGRHLGGQDRLGTRDRLPDRVIGVGRDRVPLDQVAHQLGPGGIDVGGGQPPQLALLQDVDGAPAPQPRHGQPGDAGQRRLEVERFADQAGGLGQELVALARLLGLGQRRLQPPKLARIGRVSSIHANAVRPLGHKPCPDDYRSAGFLAW